MRSQPKLLIKNNISVNFKINLKYDELNDLPP